MPVKQMLACESVMSLVEGQTVLQLMNSWKCCPKWLANTQQKLNCFVVQWQTYQRKYYANYFAMSSSDVKSTHLMISSCCCSAGRSTMLCYCLTQSVPGDQVVKWWFVGYVRMCWTSV